MNDSGRPFSELGRFELEEEIHIGTMARVFRARDMQSGDAVALKRPVGDSPRDMQRFKQEAAILAELEHPNIVGYVAAGGEVLSEAYIATEWLVGETLFARLRVGPLTIAESVAIARLTAEALGSAHRAHIVHRDVKPANLMLVEHAASRLKLIDFGIARREQAAGLRAHVSFGGGTWAYMSPEQAMGTAELGPRTDVFSLGCVLFECVSGFAAFPDERSAALVAKVWKEPPSLSDVCRAVPPKLVTLVDRLMAKDPSARPRDGSAAAAALAALGSLPQEPAELRRRNSDGSPR